MTCLMWKRMKNREEESKSAFVAVVNRLIDRWSRHIEHTWQILRFLSIIIIGASFGHLFWAAAGIGLQWIGISTIISHQDLFLIGQHVSPYLIENWIWSPMSSANTQCDWWVENCSSVRIILRLQLVYARALATTNESAWLNKLDHRFVAFRNDVLPLFLRICFHSFASSLCVQFDVSPTWIIRSARPRTAHDALSP